MLLLEVKPIFRHVFHITTTANLAKIKQRSLVPVNKSPGKQWSHITYQKPSIFVVTRKTPEVIDEVLAMMVGKEFSSDDMDNGADIDALLDQLVILTIDLAKCQDVDLEPDPNAGPWNHSKILYGTVPPDAIINVEPAKMSDGMY
jgi:hypothetical protein